MQIYDNAICVLNILYIWCTRSGNFGQIKKCSVDLLIWWDIGKCKFRQITQEYCITRQNNIIYLYESLCKDIDALVKS